MKTLKELFTFEIRSRLLNLSSLVYFAVFFAVAFLMVLAAGGAFKGATVNFGMSNKVLINSPFSLNLFVSLVSYFSLLIIAPIFGQAIYKDFENNFEQIIFSTPIKKWEYLIGRFLGATVLVTFILSSIAFGIWFSTLTPWIQPNLIGENRLIAYLLPYITTVIPNILFFGAIFFCLVCLIKKMTPVYIASIAIFIGWMISNQLTSDIDNKLIASLIDPFGMNAVGSLTEYWSVAEQNSRLILLEGYYLYNRILWGLVGIIAFFLNFKYFTFHEKSTKKKEDNNQTFFESSKSISLSTINSIYPSLNPRSYILILFHETFFEFKQVFRNIYFLVIFLCGILYMFVIGGQIGKMYGTETLPVTYKVLDYVGGSFGLFIIIIITYYSGELIWKARDSKINHIIDSKPTPTWTQYLSKFFCLAILLTFLLFTIWICGIIIQAVKGYFHFEMSLYFKHLFGIQYISYLFLCVLALFIQTFVNRKYLGHFVIIFYYISVIWLPKLGLENKLYLFGEAPLGQYSDMNGYGHFLKGYIWYSFYWFFISVILVFITNLFWVRGSDIEWKYRLLEFKRRLSFSIIIPVLILSVLTISSGGYIYYNTTKLNIYKTKTEHELESFDYEKKYKQFEKLSNPSITKVNLNVDIFPYKRKMTAKGTFFLINKHTGPVDKILINIPSIVKINKIDFSKKTKLVTKDQRLGVYIYDLISPLMPNQTLDLQFDLVVEHIGFLNHNSPTNIVYNGTFFNNRDYLPSIGYVEGYELSSDKTRKKYGLSGKPRMPNFNDKNALNRTYISNDGNWIDFEATVSTSSDQIAIAPGYLIKKWVKNDRIYFHYKMDSPILNFYSFQSGKYQVKRDKWNDVNIEVYYHQGHDKNLDRMILSVKKSLDYFTKNFSPYQHRQFRIIEFPRYQSFAQAFPNTIPFSEAIGFIADIDDIEPDDIDMPFYVTSHELAHQWWAHQVIGGNVQGSTMLSESLAQYSALMVMEKHYGKKHIKKFLKYELDRYLRGRSKENKKEMPLMYNENQGYIHYKKGSLVFYALRDYLGEKKLNNILKKFLKKTAFQDAPFPRSIDLVTIIEEETPENLKYLIEDMFKTITLFSNRAISASYVKKDENNYEITLKTTTKKIRADENGNEKTVAVNDFVDIGVRNEDGNFLYLEKHHINEENGEFKIIVSSRPYKAGIDPLNKLIDKVSDDNEVKINSAK